MEFSDGKTAPVTVVSAYLRNAWYVAMWSGDLAPGALVSRIICDEDIVFARDAGGQPAALANRCPHRFAPLSRGTCIDGIFECGYHGLRFALDGRCVENPHGNHAIPPAARVRSYPVLEKHSLVWIWMGEREADPAKVPDLSVFDTTPERYILKRDHLIMNANYLLVMNNLTDLSHTTYLHPGIIGTNDKVDDVKVDIRQSGDSLTIARDWHDSDQVPGVVRLFYTPTTDRVDRWSTMRWDAPSSMILQTGVGAAGAPRESGSGFCGVHILTPETARTTHYHFSGALRNPRHATETEDLQMLERIAATRRYAFEVQDLPMLEAQQAAIDRAERNAGSPLRPTLLSIDAGPARYERILRGLIEAEQVPPALSPG